MQKPFRVLMLVLFLDVLVATAPGEQITRALDFSDPNTFVKLIRASLEQVEQAETSDRYIQGFAPNLREWIGYLIKNEVLALSAVESQSLVKEKVGVDLYDRLEALLLKQLSSSDASLQNRTGALTALGYPLFSIDAIEPVKEFAFHQQKTTQLAAIVSLTHLEVSGAGTILNNMLLSGTLSDFWASRAVEALYYSRERDLGNVAFTLLDKKPGGMTFRSLIPILKKRSDWPQLLPTLFNSDMYHVEQKEKMSTDEKYLILAEKEMLDEIGLDPRKYLEDPTVKEKILKYASNSTGKEPGLLRIKSLIILEKTGQELKYFTDMMNDENLPNTTRIALQYIITRIKNGQRLQ